MAKLCEGSRVFTASIDAAASHTDENDKQDQLKNMLGPLYMDITCLGRPRTTGDWTWTYDPPAAPELCFWKNATSSSEYIDFPLPLRVGQKITNVAVVTYGTSSTGNGGDLKLVRRAWETGTGTGGWVTGDVNSIADVETLQAEIFNTATQQKRWTLTPTGTNGIIADGFTYYLEFSASSNADDERISVVGIEAQFGN
jgi:hypothetical protein